MNQPGMLDLTDKNALRSYHHTAAWIQKLLIELGKFYGLDVFIETGTCAGNTVEAVRDHFNKVYSIEVVKEYFLQAQKRFENAGNVRLYHGSSGEILDQILAEEDIERALFWLDAHGEGQATKEGDQVYDELDAIRSFTYESVVLLDDVHKKGDSYEVNFCYKFDPPASWHHIFISNMNLILLYTKDSEIEIPAALDVYV